MESFSEQRFTHKCDHKIYIVLETFLKQYKNGPNLLLYQTSSRGFSTRRLVEIFYWTSSSIKIATYQTSTRRSKYLLDVQQQKNSSNRHLVEFLLDVQQNFYQTSSRPDDLGHYLQMPNYIFKWKLLLTGFSFQIWSIRKQSEMKLSLSMQIPNLTGII